MLRNTIKAKHSSSKQLTATQRQQRQTKADRHIKRGSKIKARQSKGKAKADARQRHGENPQKANRRHGKGEAKAKALSVTWSKGKAKTNARARQR